MIKSKSVSPWKSRVLIMKSDERGKGERCRSQREMRLKGNQRSQLAVKKKCWVDFDSVVPSKKKLKFVGLNISESKYAHNYVKKNIQFETICQSK